MCSYAQENINMIEILNIKQDIVSLENRVTSSIKINNHEISDIQGFRQFHIFWLDFNPTEVKKEDYSDYSFLYRMSCTYFNLSTKVKKIKHEKISFLYRISPDLYYNIKSKKLKQYLKTTTLITDSTGNLVAKGDARLVYISSVFDPNDVKLAKMFFDKEIDFIFRIGKTFNRYVGIKGNELYAIEATKDGLQTYTWEEFMKCCFDEWVY
jgi:hypothetical protein